VVIIVFPMNVVNTKVVANFFIFLVIKFHVHRPDGLGVIDVRSLLSGSAHALNKSKCLICLVCILMESCLGDSRRSVVLLLRFSKMLKITTFDGLNLQL
jgi:TctA family transporter